MPIELYADRDNTGLEKMSKYFTEEQLKELDEDDKKKRRRGRKEGITDLDLIELRCLVQKMKLQKVIGLSENIPKEGTVEDYLADLVSPVEEAEPRQSRQETAALKATVEDLKADNARLQEENATLRAQVVLGAEEQLLKMRRFYYGAEEGDQDERTENQKLKEQVKDLTKRLLDAENLYFGCQDDMEKLKAELERAKLRQVEAKTSNSSLLGGGGVYYGHGGGMYNAYGGGMHSAYGTGLYNGAFVMPNQFTRRY